MKGYEVDGMQTKKTHIKQIITKVFLSHQNKTKQKQASIKHWEFPVLIYKQIERC